VLPKLVPQVTRNVLILRYEVISGLKLKLQVSPKKTKKKKKKRKKKKRTKS